ncbi:MAG: DNA cytosine methyltransferase [Burkholderiaceae bacterium]|nr:MAG: DNA cytosine methyltransferase [Burkholderiaceae bacterium]
MPHAKFTVFHMCGAIGGGAKGFQQAKATLGNLSATFETLGSVDVDAAACRDFKTITGVDATVMDLFDREQYLAWHGHQPPMDWREVTPADIRRAAQNRRPNVVFTSPPCKGFSGLLNEATSKTEKYQALNKLTLRTIWLALEAWKDDPPEFFLLENVPRISTRGRHLLDQMVSLLRHYGYAAQETRHDCGEIGELAQSRKRFLLVARHETKVPPFLYQPRHHPLKSVGSVLGRMRLPGDPSAGPMHRVPNLQWKTWLRLAFVTAGSDWRSLRDLRVSDGYLSDYALMPEREYYRGWCGVNAWDESAGTITGGMAPSRGAFSIADPRFDPGKNDFMQYGVRRWDRSTGAIINVKSPGQGGFCVADPRIDESDGARFSNVYRVVGYDDVGPTITSGAGPSSGGIAVADPRAHGGFAGAGKYAVSSYEQNTGTVISGSTTGHGAFAVADPRPPAGPLFSKYAIADWSRSTGTVIGGDDNGAYGVADPRMPRPNDKLVCMIRSLDGTWHRPFTTLEGAALQSLIDPEETFELDGLSDSAWRERIGNAVPPKAAKAIAEVMARTLLAARSGTTFLMDDQPIWVRPIALAITLPAHPAHSHA